MAWVRIDDQAPRNQKMLKAGPAACWFWVCGIAHCQSQLTNGFISNDVLSMIGVVGLTQCKRLAETLVEVGLFERAEGGYRVHDYLTHNDTRDEALAKRDAKHEQRRQAGLASGRSRRVKDERTVERPLNGPVHGSFNPGSLNPGSLNPIPSHPIRTKENARADDGSPAERVTDQFRALWQRVYGIESSLILKPLEYSDLERQLSAHGEKRLLDAMAAYFATEDEYVRKAKHPLPLFLRDPLKYLAREPVAAPTRPRGCRHEPQCLDDAAHTKLDLAERRQMS